MVGGEDREGTGQIGQGLGGLGKDLGFYPEGSGSPRGLWVEKEQDWTQVLTSAFWWLL